MSQKQEQKYEEWRQRIAQQEASNQSVRVFCRDHSLNQYTFYNWRQRLREQPVTFALVETKPAPMPVTGQIEFVLATGDLIRVASDAATLRLVLSALRETSA
ncbi:MAG: IS66 family insertion sequence element accessory protein TnpA [Gammaproteobacteria bacterium]